MFPALKEKPHTRREGGRRGKGDMERGREAERGGGRAAVSIYSIPFPGDTESLIHKQPDINHVISTEN